MAHTLVTFHAHPDDEALLTAGTMARAASAGHRVVLVVATDGGAGQVAQDFLAPGERLADRRRAELEAAASILGVQRVVGLGFGDSGSDDTEPPEGAFVRVPVDTAAEALAAVLREEHADVVTIYDRVGGYGHRDHVHVHRVGLAAARLAGTPRVYEATFNRELLLTGLALARDLGYLGADAGPPAIDVANWYRPEAEITTTVDVSSHLDAKRAAMRAHASQASSANDIDRTLALLAALPDDLFALAFGSEFFVRLDDEETGPETDLFDGLPVGRSTP